MLHIHAQKLHIVIALQEGRIRVLLFSFDLSHAFVVLRTLT